MNKLPAVIGVVNTRSRSRPNQAVLDGTPETPRNSPELRNAGLGVTRAFLDMGEVGGSNPQVHQEVPRSSGLPSCQPSLLVPARVRTRSIAGPVASVPWVWFRCA